MCGRSLVGHALHAAQEVNPENIVVVVRHQAQRVSEEVLRICPHAIIAHQDDIPGTGRALWCGLQALPENIHGGVLVMAGDTPLLEGATLSQLAHRREENNVAVSVLTTHVADPTGYGRIMRSGSASEAEAGLGGNIFGVVEHKDADESQRAITEINTSTYCFDLDFIRTALGAIGTSNAQGEMYLTDAVALASEQKAGVASLVLEDSMQVEGCNDLVQLAGLRTEMNRRICEKWMREGAGIVDPHATWIDADCMLEADCVIEPGTLLRGKTQVSSGAVVGPGTFVNACIHENAHVAYLSLENVHIEPGTQIDGLAIAPELAEYPGISSLVPSEKSRDGDPDSSTRNLHQPQK